eukprot:456923_1
MIMQLHHQRHRRTLQPNVNVNGLKIKILCNYINNPPNVYSQMKMQYKKRGGRRRNMAQYNQFKMNDNNPLSESEELMPITFMQGENLSRSSNSIVRFKSHPSKPVKDCKDGENGDW